MKPSEILDKAADLIEPEGAWTQGWYGRDGDGCHADLVADAECFCTIGAILAADGRLDFRELANKGATRYLERVVHTGGIPSWNDTKGRTQAEVVAALRQAAELARKDGQ